MQNVRSLWLMSKILIHWRNVGRGIFIIHLNNPGITVVSGRCCSMNHHGITVGWAGGSGRITKQGTQTRAHTRPRQLRCPRPPLHIHEDIIKANFSLICFGTSRAFKWVASFPCQGPQRRQFWRSAGFSLERVRSFFFFPKCWQGLFYSFLGN